MNPNQPKTICGDCIEVMRGMKPDSVDLVVGSPPYLLARTYGFKGKQWWDSYETWVERMLAIVTEAARICTGPVVIVAANPTRKRSYYPAVEALMVRWFERGGECQLYRPVYWHKVSIPGSGQSDGFRGDVEYCCVFKRPGELPWSDNTVCGWPPRWAPGGEMSHRNSSGKRVNQWGPVGGPGGGGGRRKNGDRKPNRMEPQPKQITRRRDNGKRDSGTYQPPVLANPGNYIETHEVIHANVGGGAMGKKMAHENEAPYPESIPERFIRSFCPPDGVILDPFMGSGATLAVAVEFGRRAIGIDIRQSQVELTKRRLASVQRSLIS